MMHKRKTSLTRLVKLGVAVKSDSTVEPQLMCEGKILGVWQGLGVA